MQVIKKYNVVALGARDYYQVAIALQEANMLEYLITDIFLGASFKNLSSTRHTQYIQHRKTLSLYPFFFAQKILAKKSNLGNILNRYLVDFAFGFISGIITKITTNRAVVYSYYVEGFSCFYKLINARPDSMVIFQVHPTAHYQNEILNDDLKLFEKHSPGVNFIDDMEVTYSVHDFKNYLQCLEEANWILCASTFTARSINKYKDLSNKITVVPYGSRFEGIQHADQSICTGPKYYKPGKIRLLTVGQLVQRKGMHWAFMAMNELSKCNEYDWIVVSNTCDPSIRLMAPENVRFLTSLTEKELTEVFREADLFVLPSLVEGFGLVYIEALSNGLPIIYTQNTGPADFCIDGCQGFIADAFNYKSLYYIFDYLSNKRHILLDMKKDAKVLSTEISWFNFRKKVAGILSAL